MCKLTEIILSSCSVEDKQKRGRGLHSSCQASIYLYTKQKTELEVVICNVDNLSTLLGFKFN